MQLCLGGLYARDAVGVGLDLGRDEGGDVLVQVILVVAERVAGLGDGGEGCWVGEDLVQVRDGVVVGWRVTLAMVCVVVCPRGAGTRVQRGRRGGRHEFHLHLH